jgi:heme-degrading monooxygenase HmoA
MESKMKNIILKSFLGSCFYLVSAQFLTANDCESLVRVIPSEIGKSIKMFVAIYHWKLKPGKEEQFQQAWAKLTITIRQRFGSYGSRLHKTADGTWLAYAQWPSREAWDSFSLQDPESIATRKQMLEAIESKFPDITMDVSEDYLVHPTP